MIMAKPLDMSTTICGDRVRRRVAVYITRDQYLAEEATQAAWLIAWKKLRKVRDEDHLKPWLGSVAAYEAKRVLRNTTPIWVR